MIDRHTFLVPLAMGLSPLVWADNEEPPQEPEPTTAAFQMLDDHRKEVTNFNIETVRGMVWSPDKTRLYAINTHGSRLLYHVDGDGTIDAEWTTVNNPVAVDIWERTSTEFDLIVAGGSTHTVARHDSNTGAILDLLIVPSEPGDLVVTPDGHAWVSCKGADVVVEIDLATFSIVSTFSIPSERPRFLSWHLNDAVSAGYRVFVAPMISGNNTRTVGIPGAPSEIRALPLDNPATPTLEGLPDEDLFEMLPGTTTVLPVVKGLGTLVMEHVKHPTANEMWVLSIVSKNADVTRQTEPLLQADFADNALTILTLPAQGATPIQAPAYIDLDDSVTGGPKNYATSTSCSFPFAAAIDPLTGWALVASSTNDRIVLLDPAGSRQWQRDLPQGAIPRDILIDRPTDTCTIYLWGTNQLYVMAMSDLNAPALLLDLGNDPTSDFVADGREHWYDADNSLNGRNTCNTCHPGGGSDFLGWALGDPPLDRKDAMVTQSLLGIEDTFPYHWRGERQLRDFNRLAFPGLLGGTSLADTPGDDFDEFKEFVFSLQPPRNPHEDWQRVVSDYIAPPGSFPTNGQSVFQNQDGLFGGFTCAECHTQPEGSNGGISFDNGGAAGVPSNANLDVAHLRQLFNKDGGGVSVNLPGGTVTLPRLGYGLAHGGANLDIFDFLNPIVFALSAQQRLDVTEFVNQWDQGIAPAAQLGWLMDQAGAAASLSAVNTYLLPQAANGWLDTVAFGSIQDASGASVFARWLYDPVAGNFTANDAAITIAGRPAGTALLVDFSTQASAGTASNTFLGLPPGNGRRFALDPDNDRLTDGEELALTPTATDPEERDSDGDGDPDGHEVANPGDPQNPTVLANDTTAPSLLPGYPQFLDVSTSTAEYELRFDEPVTYTITYSRPGEPALTRSRYHPVMEDTIVLQDMRPSSMGATVGAFTIPPTVSQYTLSMVMTDLGGNTTSVNIAHQPTLEDALEPLLEPASTLGVITRRLGALTMNATSAGSTLTATVNATVDMIHESLNAGVPGVPNLRENQRVFAQILKNTGTGWQVVPTSQITSGDVFSTYTVDGATPGVFNDVLISAQTNTSGAVSLNFNVTGLNTGDLVRFNILGIVTNTSGGPVNDLVGLSLVSSLLPSTEDDPGADLRGVQVTF